MLLATYNIQFGRGRDGRVDLARIAGEVAAADILALQEVDRFWTRSGAVDQVAELEALFPDRFVVYGAGVDENASKRDEDGTIRNRRRQFGNLIVSRWPIVSARNHLLPKHGMLGALSVQRSALEAAIEAPGGPLRVYSVHLNHTSGPERLAQATALLSILQAAPTSGGGRSGAASEWDQDGLAPAMPESAVLLGDFNMLPDSPEYLALVGQRDPKYGRLTRLGGLVDAWEYLGNESDAEDGFTSIQPDRRRRIDFAFVETGTAQRLRRIWVDQEAVGSDHQPMWLELE